MDYQPASGALLDAGCVGDVTVGGVADSGRRDHDDDYDMRTAVALGSNLGDRLENLRTARQQLINLADVKPPVFCSAVYETEPIDCEPGAPKFLNAVIEFDYTGDPLHLLEQVIRIEESLGRKRYHRKNVSRSIDIDVLYCGDRHIRNERLQLRSE